MRFITSPFERRKGEDVGIEVMLLIALGGGLALIAMAVLTIRVLDAAVDHPGIQITEDQYEALIRDVRQRLDTDLATQPPAYPEALLRAAENPN